MTCIVALVEQGVTYFGGDSLLVNVPDDFHHTAKVSQIVRSEPKVFRKGDMFFGYSGSARMGQLLQYEFELPEYVSGTSKMKYLVSNFIPALQTCFTKADFDTGSKLEGNVLLSLETELFHIGGAWNVNSPVDPYYSIGKAHEVATGSLHSTLQLGIAPLQRLKLALLATERHTCVTSQPFHYITNEMEQPELLP